MAAVLWSYVAEQDPRARLEAAFYFFEVVARYIGIVLLSGLRSDRGLFEASRGSWQGRGAPPSVIMQRPTLGSWVRFSADAAKGVRRLLESDGSAVFEAFKVTPGDRIANVISRPLGAILSKAVERRNDWRGHDAASSGSERRRRIDFMAALIHELRLVLDGALDDWHLIQPLSMAGRSGDYGVAASVMQGANPRVRARPMQLSHVVDTERLYLLQAGSTRALELVPLIRAVKSDEAAESAIYFFDRASTAEVRWLSYDSQGQPEVINELPDWLPLLLSDLDTPLSTGSERRPDLRDETATSPTPVTEAPGSAEIRANNGPVPLQDLPNFIARAVRLGVPALEVRRDMGGASFHALSRVGWVKPSDRSLRVTAHVPIEFAPQVAGPVLYEVPVSADDRPGIELTVEDDRDAYAAILILVAAAALDLGWPLDGLDARSAIHTAVGGLRLYKAEVRWGAGTWPPARVGPRAQLALWEGCIAELRSRPGFETTNAKASPEGLRLAWADGITVGLRMDATSCYVYIELDDKGAHRARIDRLIFRKQKLDSLLASDAFWHRRLGALMVFECVGNASQTIQEEPRVLVDGLINAGESVATALTETP